MIAVAELKHVLTNIGEKLSPEEIDNLVKEADPEGKGQVAADDFIKVRRGGAVPHMSCAHRLDNPVTLAFAPCLSPAALSRR